MQGISEARQGVNSVSRPCEEQQAEVQGND